MGIIYAFLDLETTGLDPDADEILEIAWEFTDEHFHRIGVRFHALVEPNWARAWPRIRANEYVRDMHTKSGLIEDLKNDLHPRLDLDDIADTLDSAIEALPAHEALHLAGASVHFDRDFLKAHGFRHLIESRFHHRLLDLSAVKLMLRSSGVDYRVVWNLIPHRAFHDVDESVRQAIAFREVFSPIARCTREHV